MLPLEIAGIVALATVLVFGLLSLLRAAADGDAELTREWREEAVKYDTGDLWTDWDSIYSADYDEEDA